ncbi:helix-turn-helix domain-containing protein [Mycolicibacterium neoaurum]|uniref:helix-turn-helix transcriptional regulator n=1 Tax=Mycolicibacterium neoaurum TaxID=1795 RepID=UPI001BCD24C6|nr:helix-turn-helix domain-containing protein [Mycolicibacterium neoaurum]QVI29928.1 helix-turn-helix domain-containing protein [Mycolicibacterium neoaurum]
MIERLTTAQAAAYLGKPEATLRWWRHRDIGPRSYLIGRGVVYDRADLDQWLADQKAATMRGGNR